MKKKYYLIRVEGGVEAFTVGPFDRQVLRDAAARRAHEVQDDDDSILWADTDEKGKLTVGSYASAFFSPNRQ
jgi:hypothetical protein